MGELALTNPKTTVPNISWQQITSCLSNWLRRNKEVLELLVLSFSLTLASCAFYLSVLLTWTQPGFPLDDSWIHLQFARTIYEGHPWEYSPGIPSTGSTSPLWSILLSFLFLFTQDSVNLVWGTYILSMVFYCSCTFLVGLIVKSYTQHTAWSCFAATTFVLLPRNTWLMLSGMETPLFVFMLMLSVYLLNKTEMRYDPVLGVVAGLAYLSRPEGVLIIAVCFPVRIFIIAARKQFDPRRLGSFVLAGALAALIAAPWVMYCLSTTGYPLPDTFYAKVHVPTLLEIEYWDSWWIAWLSEFPFISIGAVAGIYLAAKGKPYTWLLGISLFLLYRFSSPYGALINNARYLVPVFDLLLVTAVAGTSCLIQRAYQQVSSPVSGLNERALVTFVFVGLIMVPLLPQYFGQAPFYGNAVKNINEQQVSIGMWLRYNTPENAVLAVHDAGALRFFSERSIIDLAGLVTPAIVHGNMTVVQTLIYLRHQGCDYFVFFDELFVYGARLAGAYKTLYTVHLTDNVISGRDTMSVFWVNWSMTSYV